MKRIFLLSVLTLLLCIPMLAGTPKDTVRILAIGNSFSQDAVEQNLYELAEADGIPVIIGNVFIGGCTLERHLNNAKNNVADYAYRKIGEGGSAVKKEIRGMTLEKILADEPWDYVSFQQASPLSGKYETFESFLPALYEYVKARVPKDARFMMHQTWAYQQDSGHSGFKNYGQNQMTMYNAIMDAVQKAAADNDIEIVIPSGTAIQNGRNSFIGDAFNRDGYHLEVNYGRYTAACAWFEKISGMSVVGNAYYPGTVDKAYADVAQNAAHFAVLEPYSVNPMTDFQSPEITSDGKTPVYIDFGSSKATSWNNVMVYEISDKPLSLKDENGDYTAITISSMSGFTGMNNGVGTEPDGQDMVAGGITWLRDAWVDGIVVAGTKGQGDTDPASITLSGLDPGTAYDFSILAVRYNGSADARITRFTVSGASVSEPVEIKPGMKSWTGTDLDKHVAVFNDVMPASDGTVTISVTGIDTGSAADGNINAMRISM